MNFREYLIEEDKGKDSKKTLTKIKKEVESLQGKFSDGEGKKARAAVHKITDKYFDDLTGNTIMGMEIMADQLWNVGDTKEKVDLSSIISTLGNLVKGSK